MAFIYELLCPKTGDVRYIGKAVDPSRRLRQHLSASSLMKSYTNRWIAGLIREGHRPMLRVVLAIGADENWQEVEKQCIALGFALGLPLTNTSAGGEGALITDPEVEARRVAKVTATWRSPDIRAKQSAHLKAVCNQPDKIDANRQRMKEKWLDPLYADRCSEVVKLAYASADARKAQSERSKKAHQCSDTATRRNASLKAAWNVPEANRSARIEALKAGNAKPEVKAWRAAEMKKRHKDPSYREKIKVAMSDPEMIKRRNEAIKAGWARRLGAQAPQ